MGELAQVGPGCRLRLVVVPALLPLLTREAAARPGALYKGRGTGIGGGGIFFVTTFSSFASFALRFLGCL